MATLVSIQGEMQLSLNLLGRSWDPFQKDLEWFEYELRVEGAPASVLCALGETGYGAPQETRSARGKFNRKEFNDLLRGLDDLLEGALQMRFEPSDLNFCLEWSHETPLVYLAVTWFDLAFSERRLDQRFPTAHAGFRFLTDGEALAGFRDALEQEFSPQAAARRTSTRVN